MKRSSSNTSDGVPKSPTRWLRWILLYIAGLIAFVILGYISSLLFDNPAFRAFAETAARVGLWLGAIAVAVLVCDIAALVVYMIRFGKADDGDPIAADGGPNPFLSTMPLAYSRFKQLGRRSSFITTESLVEGTATRGERLVVLGIIVFLVSFFLIFVAIALVTLDEFSILALAWPSIPGLVVYVQLRDGWREYRAAKKKLRANPGQQRKN